MGLIRSVRLSDSPYLKSVTLYRCDEDVSDLAVPDESWDLVVMKHEGTVRVLLTGQTTRAVPLRFSPGDEYLTLSFRASSFLRVLSAETLLDQGEMLPMLASRTFRLGADTVEIPNFENADDLASRLARLGILESDALVAGVLMGHPLAASERSVQRHFHRTTGMTSHSFYQIRRAHDAASRLAAGVSAADAALDAGYSDQPHMIRSLKRILGQTPSEILRTRPPLLL